MLTAAPEGGARGGLEAAKGGAGQGATVALGSMKQHLREPQVVQLGQITHPYLHHCCHAHFRAFLCRQLPVIDLPFAL